ncbi:MAG TPA: RES family NAD+ phosphorylase [Burkholderiaceae bacterium]|nr:RES family NAD+ phosphorylase [Burkholderiaceae bacterium]
MTVKLSQIAWSPCHRLVASRYPVVGVYDRAADPADLDVVLAIEALTNPLLRQEREQLSLIPADNRVTGPGASLIMSAFVHPNPQGSRFSNGSFGVYYASNAIETAVAEVSHHRARFLACTKEPPIDIDVRWIQADLRERLHDLRGRQHEYPDVYARDSYRTSQAFGQQLRGERSAGIVYDSVRRFVGQCVAVFKPTALTNAHSVGHIGLRWDGAAISHWFIKGQVRDVGA